MKPRTLLLAAVATAAFAAPATAAEPESGSVTTTQPTATWTGSIDDPGAYDLAGWYLGFMGPTCAPPFCDEFALNVGAGGTALTIEVAGNGAENVAFEVEDPNGDSVYVDVEDTEFAASRSRTIEDPAPGDWIIRVSGTGTFDYTGRATLGGATAPPAPVAPTGGQAAPPPVQPQPSPPPQQQPEPAGGERRRAPAPTVTIRPLSRTARSARRLRRGARVSVGLDASGPLRDVTVALVPAGRSPKILGSGRLASLGRLGHRQGQARAVGEARPLSPHRGWCGRAGAPSGGLAVRRRYALIR